MIPGLLAKEVSAALREFIVTGYETETPPFKGELGRIVFTTSKGLTGVGLPRKASKKELTEGTHYSLNSPDKTTQNVALGWEDIQHLQEGSIIKTFIDNTLPGGPVERKVSYDWPFFRPDREEDYRVAWEIFQQYTTVNEAV